MQDRDALDKLYDELIALRQKIARNAGFENYRDYKFAAMGRFDYTQQIVMIFMLPLHRNYTYHQSD